MDEVTALQTWERQPEETAKSYGAFAVYRDMGVQRSLAKAAARFYQMPIETGAKPHQVKQFGEWSRAHRWVQRAAAYDAQQDRENQAKRKQQAEDARDRALRTAQLAQRLAVKGMIQIDGRIGNAEENPPLSLLRYWKEATELEFVALGMPIHVQRTAIEEEIPEEVDENRALLNRANQMLDSYKRGPKGRR